MKRLLGQQPIAYLFLAPAGLVLGLLAFWPMLSALWISFTDFSMLQPARSVGFGNYVTLLRDPFFWNAAGNTFVYMIVVVPVLVIAPIFLASLVNASLPGIRIFRAIYYLPVVTSLVVTGLMWKWLYQEQGRYHIRAGCVARRSRDLALRRHGSDDLDRPWLLYGHLSCRHAVYPKVLV
jgi:putative chitobiose transport system permease protein